MNDGMKNGRHGQKFETPAEKKIAVVHFPRQADFFFLGGGLFHIITSTLKIRDTASSKKILKFKINRKSHYLQSHCKIHSICRLVKGES